jgi:hypothetical protein
MKKTASSKPKIKKVVLAYSGGLDTSVILKWLQDEYDCEVITFTADIGQGEELEPARKKAQQFGIKKIYIQDLREEFVRDFVFPMFRANTVYEGEYLLGTSIARPLIAKQLIEIAKKEKADAISHGATGKGNDQVRFELGAYALMPNIKTCYHGISCWPMPIVMASRSITKNVKARHPFQWMPICCIFLTKVACSKIRTVNRPHKACGASRCRSRKRPISLR